MRDFKIIALYKGDEFVDVGTYFEISKRQKIKLNTLYAIKTKKSKKWQVEEIPNED